LEMEVRMDILFPLRKVRKKLLFKLRTTMNYFATVTQHERMHDSSFK